jgi:hypothetical protein
MNDEIGTGSGRGRGDRWEGPRLARHSFTFGGVLLGPRPVLLGIKDPFLGEIS